MFITISTENVFGFQLDSNPWAFGAHFSASSAYHISYSDNVHYWFKTLRKHIQATPNFRRFMHKSSFVLADREGAVSYIIQWSVLRFLKWLWIHIMAAI